MATANSKQVIDATGVVDVFDVGNKPSCITYYGGRLWIATHNILFRSKMVAYYYDKKGRQAHKPEHIYDTCQSAGRYI